MNEAKVSNYKRRPHKIVYTMITEDGKQVELWAGGVIKYLREIGCKLSKSYLTNYIPKLPGHIVVVADIMAEKISFKERARLRWENLGYEGVEGFDGKVTAAKVWRVLVRDNNKTLPSEQLIRDRLNQGYRNRSRLLGENATPIYRGCRYELVEGFDKPVTAVEIYDYYKSQNIECPSVWTIRDRLKAGLRDTASLTAFLKVGKPRGRERTPGVKTKHEKDLILAYSSLKEEVDNLMKSQTKDARPMKEWVGFDKKYYRRGYT